MVKNVYEVYSDFTYLGIKFESGQIIECHNINVIVVRDKERKVSTPILMDIYSDAIRKDFYDSVRFIYDNKKHLQIKTQI